MPTNSLSQNVIWDSPTLKPENFPRSFIRRQIFCLQKKQKATQQKQSCPHPSASGLMQIPVVAEPAHSRPNYCIIHFSWRARSLDQIIDGSVCLANYSRSHIEIHFLQQLYIGTLLIACTWKWMNFSSSLFNYSWFLVAFVVARKAWAAEIS